MTQRIIVAIDGSENSYRAGEEAIDLAKCHEGSVVNIITVANIHDAKDDILRVGAAGLEVERRQKTYPLEQRCQEENVAYEVNILHGEPAIEIVRHAKETKASKIVVGTQGKSAFQEMFVGSVSKQVIKKSPCTVVLVK